MTNPRQQIKQIPPDIVNKRFEFVKNKPLKQNLANTLSYITFLDSLEEALELPKLYKTQIYKTIIIFSAAIVESLLHYKLKELINEGEVKNEDIFRKKFKYEEMSKVMLLEEIPYSIVLCKKLPLVQELKNSTHSNETIQCAKRCGLLTPRLHELCTEIKDLRNKLHMAAMIDLDDQYTRKAMEEVFKKVKKIIVRIEKF